MDGATSEGLTLEAIEEALRGRRWEALAEGLGFAVERREIPKRAAAAWGLDEAVVEAFEGLEVLAAGAAHRLVLARGEVPYRVMRRAVLQAARHNPETCVIWWWERGQRAAAAVADRRSGGRRFVRWMETDVEHADPVSLEQWRALGLEGLADGDAVDRAEAVHRHAVDALDQEAVTREFFRGFREALEALTGEMTGGPEEPKARHDVALSTLLRIVFLYFLQQREALDGDRRFVVRRLREARGEGVSFYRAVLRPLFFGALNCEPPERGPQARALGRLPFLNGGLFEPLALEAEHPEMDWPNGVWAEVLEGLLERFHFTAAPGDGEDECRAVDPEMLGKVFEGLMYGEERQDSGSFYTPRDVVRRIVEEALVGYLVDALDEESGVEGRREDVERLVGAGEAPECGETADRLREAVGSMTVLDPAVGTGAFLLEALRRLEHCYRGLGMSAQFEGRHALRAEIVHRHLFGVDIQTTAVRICELRLWLAIFVATPEADIEALPPLPNLGHRVRCGNALVAPEDLVELRADGEAESRGWAASARGGAGAEDGVLRQKIRREQRAYLSSHGSEKRAHRRKLEAFERQMQEAMFERRLELLRERRDPIEKFAASEDLFGEPVELSDAQSDRLEALDAKIEAVEEALEDLRGERRRPGGFSFGTHFGASLDDGGFDVVVTNPPWVRANRLDRDQKQLMKRRYASFRATLWPGADRLGIRLPFGAQVDMAALFVERSLELLGSGGHLGVLLPAKVFGSLHGAGLRRHLAGHEVRAIEDFSEADRSMFDATVYPAMLHARKPAGRKGACASGEEKTGRGRRRSLGGRDGPRAPGGPGGAGRRPTEVSVWRGRQRESWSQTVETMPVVGRHVGEPWAFVPPEVRAIFETMRARSVPMGEVEALAPRRGVMTGRNGVFVLDEEEARELVGGLESPRLRPVFGGRDVRVGSVRRERWILWGYDEALEPVDGMPERLEVYFEEHRHTLEARSDWRNGQKLWEIYRLKEGVVEPKVVWRDLGPRLEAAVAPADSVPLNTVYFVPVEDRRRADVLCALFNSRPMRAVARAVGERARGGWRRHYAWVMRMLPVPEGLAGWLAGRRRVDGLDARTAGVVGAAREAGPSPEAAIADLYGVGEGALGRLKDWMHRGNGQGEREAA